VQALLIGSGKPNAAHLVIKKRGANLVDA